MTDKMKRPSIITTNRSRFDANLTTMRGDLQHSTSIAVFYYNQHEYSRAITYYQQALNIAREVKNLREKPMLSGVLPRLKGI